MTEGNVNTDMPDKINLSFDDLFSNIQMALMLLSGDNKIIKVNAGACTFFDKNPAALTGLYLSDILKGCSYDSNGYSINDVNSLSLTKEKPINFDLTCKYNDAIRASASITLINEKKGLKVVQINSIEEFKSSGQKIIEQGHLLVELINSTPDNIFIKDLNSKFILANTGVSNTMGAKSPEELIGKSDFDFHPKKLATKYYQDEQEIIKTGKPALNIVEKVVDDDHNIKWYSTSKMPFKDKNGETIGIMGIGRDITRSVKEKKALKKAKYEAERADRLKSSFLANMSHEIRTPLNGILGFSQFLKQSSLSDQKKEKYLDIILNNGKQLLNLINDIIDVSKIESGQLSINKKPFSLNKLFNQLNQLFTGDLYQKNKTDVKLIFNKAFEDGDDMIYTDESRLKQVLFNLLTNAVKFTTKGSIECYYTLKEKSLHFGVKDTGIGISCENQQVIFERFTQADNSLTRQYGGTGLGLSISKGIVDLLGGKLGVTSEINTGSEFYFTLPYFKNPDDVTIQDISLQKRVLIFDKHSDIFTELFYTLEEKELTTIQVKSYEEMTHLFNEHESIPNLIIFYLKEEDDTEVNNVISLLPYTPIIFLSDKKKSSYKSKYLKTRLYEHIDLPYENRHLLAVVERLLR